MALYGLTVHNTIKVKGKVKKHAITILIDSGATHSFIDPGTAGMIGGVATLTIPLSVTVADGNKLASESICQEFQWEMQGHKFSADLRVLPLGGCDVTLRVDWLKKYSSVTFDYNTMEVTLVIGKKKVTLKGTCEEGFLKFISCKGLSKLFNKTKQGLVGYLFYMNSGTDVIEVPGVVKSLLQSYKEVFEQPPGLPPRRRQDHRIPLKQESEPMNARPYRSPQFQKDEIERQVKEMLASGIIQPSNSPFASLVLLVLKNDGSWRLCVDYRKLNELTVKNKFPIPIIEELLDEFHGARWFSKLDLRSGYHQVRVAEEYIQKTAFGTHSRHYEFKVMPFGLTNAPTSFQSLMNEVFESLIRKCVLVSFDDILVYSSTLEDHVTHLQ